MMRNLVLVILLFSNVAFAKTSLNLSFSHAGLTVNGRLQLPDGTGKFPLIIINPGSGPNDRNGTAVMSGGNVACLYPGLLGDTLRPYKELSEALSDSGYAVFTYDKVEYTYPNPGTITFFKLWLPVKSAIGYLKTRPEIDTNQIVLLGHSEGSSMIPYITRTEPSLKALISLAGPRRPLDTILAYQLVYIAQTCNGDTNLAKSQGNQVLQYMANVRAGNYTGSTPPLFGVPPAVWQEYLKVVDSVSINYNIAAKPTLFIGLGDDFNVPVQTELVRFQNEISIAADFYNIAGLNHFITPATVPAVSELVTDTIIYWLRSKLPLSVTAVNENHNSISVVVDNGSIQISSERELIQRIRITDTNGRLLKEQSLRSYKESIPAASLAAHIYIVEVFTRAGKKVFKISALQSPK